MGLHGMLQRYRDKERDLLILLYYDRKKWIQGEKCEEMRTGYDCCNTS
jgi:hypothetical protein